MGQPVYYLAHDPVANCEGIIDDYSAEAIATAAEHGIVFYAVDADGARTAVDAAEVKKPVSNDQRFTIVQPQYVDDRMKAVVAVFESLANSMPPATMADEGEGGVPTFEQALEELRKIVYGSGKGGRE